MHALARDDGIAVLWATHLIDEIAPDDQVVVLHRGRIRAAGSVGDVNAAAGCASIGETLHRVTADRPEREHGIVVMTGARHLLCLKAIVVREVLRFLHQRERFFAALVRPLVWLFVFAAGFRVGARRLLSCRPTRPTSSTRSTSSPA